MGFYVSNTEEDYNNITVVDDDGDIVMTYKNIENLFEGGYRFEACISQAALLEAVCYHYLILEKDFKNLTFNSASEKRIRTNNLTFGQTKDLLISHKILTEDKQVQILEEYVNNRNLLIHRLVAEMRLIDFDEFFNNGKELLFTIWGQVLRSTEEVRKNTK